MVHSRNTAVALIRSFFNACLMMKVWVYRLKSSKTTPNFWYWQKGNRHLTLNPHEIQREQYPTSNKNKSEGTMEEKPSSCPLFHSKRSSKIIKQNLALQAGQRAIEKLQSYDINCRKSGKRRTAIPFKLNKSASLFAVMKSFVGKDLSTVSMPVSKNHD